MCLPAWPLAGPCCISCVLMAAGELGAPLLPGHPVTASFFLLALGCHLGLLCPLVAVQMTPGRHRDGFSATAWSLQGYGNVPGWPSCQARCRWLSQAILAPALPCRRSLTAARPRPSALPLLWGCLRPGLQEGSVTQFIRPLEPLSCNHSSREKWKHIYFSISVAQC